jgi:hypothetical protein
MKTKDVTRRPPRTSKSAKCGYCGDTGLIKIKSDGRRPQLYGGRLTLFPLGLTKFPCPRKNCAAGRQRWRESDEWLRRNP